MDGVSLAIGAGWVVFHVVTLFGVIYWYASDAMGVGLLHSLVVPPSLFAC